MANYRSWSLLAITILSFCLGMQVLGTTLTLWDVEFVPDNAWEALSEGFSLPQSLFLIAHPPRFHVKVAISSDPLKEAPVVHAFLAPPQSPRACDDEVTILTPISGSFSMSQKIKPVALLIEDDDDMIAMLRLFLEAEGYRVRVVYNGGHALQLIESMIELPNIVILDVLLPGIDGLTVLERLRRRPIWAAVPVIMVTSCSEEDDVSRAVAGGANDYIVKPFHPRVLISRIQALLAARTRNYSDNSGNLAKREESIATDKEM